MIQKKRLIDVFPDWMVNGIFTELNQLAVPWKNEITADLLDLEYFGNHSGEKYIAPLLEKMLENEILSQSRIQTLANILYARNINQWMRLYALYKLDYNPIENYSMIETEDGTNARNDDFTNTSNSTNTSNTTNIDQQFAFNSNDWENVNKNTTEDNRTDQNTSKNIGTSTNQNSRTLTRSGNIGVTTSQQMMESEIELWKWNFIEQLFDDVDKLLTLKIYETEV